jgi:raffinose/stachyose/melibiose transport system substrate-binding protein
MKRAGASSTNTCPCSGPGNLTLRPTAHSWHLTATKEGCDAYAKGSPPQGPFLSKACELPADVSQVAKDTKNYFDTGKASPALEFKSPIKGPALEQICIQVGTAQVDAKKGAELYDEDVKKQAQQLGLPGWE